MDLKDRRARDALQALLILEEAGFAARLAGGCVRDRLMGVAPMDFDIATDATPPDTTAAFRAQGYKVVPTGIDHGTVTVVAPSGPIEITTLRRDVATDGRRAQVAFGTSFEEDAERRDFTINAMFEDARQQIFDTFGGQSDLTAKRLRFVGDAPTRIREDYLRILRLFRFWAKLGFTPVSGTLEAVSQEKGGLTGISQERITSELLKTLAGDFAGAPMAALHTTGVWSVVMPELQKKRMDPTPPLPHSFWPLALEIAPDRRGMAALGAICLWEWGEQSTEAWTALGTRLKLSRADVRSFAWWPRLIARLSSLGPEPADLLLFAEECDHHGGADSLETFYGPMVKALAATQDQAFAPLLTPWNRLSRMDATQGHRRRNAPPLSGKDLMTHLGLSQGPELGEVLVQLRRGYLNGEWQSRDEGLAYLTRCGSTKHGG